MKESVLLEEELKSARDVANKLKVGMKEVIHGRDETLDLVITALLADGHALLEDYPGSGKTTLAKTLGRLIDSGGSLFHSFKRVQFTPDMLPSDVLGVSIFESKSEAFNFVRGPIFSHIVLADEINRTGPKVQSAFLECMAEKQVTIDNHTYPLDPLFFVLGTQNPLDMAGTYPLPQVQLDRFLFKIPMSYVDAITEVEILEKSALIQERSQNIGSVVTREDILKTREVVLKVYSSLPVRQAIVNLVQSTRNNPNISFGASTRAAIYLQNAMRARAVTKGRDYVTEDDLKALGRYVLGHRLKFMPSAGDPRRALEDLIEKAVEEIVTGVSNQR
jgi:MoxR-like ATPase